MVSHLRLPQQISRSAIPLDGPGLVTATVSPAAILAPPMGSFVRLGGIAFDSSGTLYGVSGGSDNQGTLMTIDPTNGAATVIGLLSDANAAVDGLRFNLQGILYGSSFDNTAGVGKLLTIDPSNAQVLTSLTLMGSGNSFCPGIA